MVFSRGEPRPVSFLMASTQLMNMFHDGSNGTMLVLSSPADVIGRVAVRARHALTHGVMEPEVVVAAVLVITTREVHDWNRCEAAVPHELQPALVRTLDGPEVADRARRNRVRVLIEAADALVQIEKLLRRDRAGRQGLQAVLHADVVERPQREPGLHIHPVDVARDVVHGAADTARIRLRIVPIRLRHDRMHA